LITNDIG